MLRRPQYSARVAARPCGCHAAPRRPVARRSNAGRAADQPQPAEGAEQGRGLLHGLQEVLHPFVDRKANARFLALALGGMLCSVATLIHDSFLGVFMRDQLGMTNTRIGSIQALSQLLCQVSKSFSGVLGDVLGSQVKILVFGTALTAACKPLFAASSLVYGSFGAAACLWCITVGKLMDRVSKGFREAPTKALISQTARDSNESADSAFSVRQSLATIGSLVGSGVASAIFLASGQSYVATFAAAAVPPVLALAWLCFTFRAELFGEQPGKQTLVATMDASRDGGGAAAGEEEMSWAQKGRALVAAFQPAYWQAIAVVAVLYFGRFDFTFVTLRAQTVLSHAALCFPRAALPLLASATMLATSLTALTTGRFAKGRGVSTRNSVLVAGCLMLTVANALLSAPFAANMAGMMAACVCIGVHMGMTHGLALSMLSSYMPQDRIPGIGKVAGSAWSFTDAILGCFLAGSNWLAGYLTDLTVARSLGNIGCFGGGAVASVAAIALLLVFVQFGALGKPLPVRQKG